MKIFARKPIVCHTQARVKNRPWMRRRGRRRRSKILVEDDQPATMKFSATPWRPREVSYLYVVRARETPKRRGGNP